MGERYAYDIEAVARGYLSAVTAIGQEGPRIMQLRISEVLTYLDMNRAALERTLAGVPAAMCELRPSPERWSVAEVLQHLALVEGRITDLLASRIGAARTAGLGPEREDSPVTPTFDMTRVLDRGRPITAGEAVLPNEPLDLSAARAMLEDRRARLRAVMISADGLALEHVTAPNRVLGTLNAYQWVLFVGAHEARHTAQIREVVAELSRVIQ